MDNLRWRVLLILLVVIAGIVFLAPSFTSHLQPGWTKVLPTGRIHLGLDLQGGIYLILEVETDKAVANAVESMAQELTDSLRAQKVGFIKVARVKDRELEVLLPGPDQVNQVRQILEREFPKLELESAAAGGAGTKLLLALEPKEVQRIREMSVSQGLETIRNRIDQFGVSEPDVRPEGTDRILLQLPGISNFQDAVNLIGKTAVLQFKLVAKDVTEQDIREGKLPPGVKVYPMRVFDTTRGGPSETALEDRTLMTGQYITGARAAIDPSGAFYVSIEFDPQGARIFDRITAENIGRELAIVLDGVVYSAPVIQQEINGGRAQISGSFTENEAKVLAIALRTGRLPAPVKILDQQSVGPSLGEDSIHRGLLACVVGGIGIVLFMIIYYRLAGVIADLALVLNVFLILAAMAALGATLTLPGIAGIALTIGIAVDANVLIYERIREELRWGKTPRAAVDLGYSRATLTILDANVTSLIAALVLYQFGSGPVRGFAVTLSIGLAANLFTAIMVTRAMFDYLLSVRHVKTLSI